MNDELTENNTKRLNFGLLLLISFVLFNLGYVIDQSIRWSDHAKGFQNGLNHILLTGIVWCMVFLPWSLLIVALYRWRQWQRFRTPWVLAPAVLMFLVAIGGLVFQPQTPSERFQRFAVTEFPTNAHNIRCHFSGGGIADYTDTYYFETTPEEVDRIIRELDLEEDILYGREGLTHTAVSPLPNCPDFKTWVGAKQYRANDDDSDWFYYLITDASRTKVYMMIFCT